MKNYLLILLVIGFSACSSKEEYILFNKAEVQNSPAANEETLRELDSMQFEYKILPHDRISVSVYKHPDLSTRNLNGQQLERGLLVNSRGDIRLPLIRNIHIAGLTQTQAEEKLYSAFRTYLKHPDVQVEVLNKRAYIVGEVRNPGEFPLVNERITLLQLIAKSGDFTNDANRRSILIFKNGNQSKVKTRIVNLLDANSLRTANLMIEPNDVVYVMPTDMKAFNQRVNEINPIFNLVGNVLQPFVNIKFLTQ